MYTFNFVRDFKNYTYEYTDDECIEYINANSDIVREYSVMTKKRDRLESHLTFYFISEYNMENVFKRQNTRITSNSHKFMIELLNEYHFEECRKYKIVCYYDGYEFAPLKFTDNIYTEMAEYVYPQIKESLENFGNRTKQHNNLVSLMEIV